MDIVLVGPGWLGAPLATSLAARLSAERVAPAGLPDPVAGRGRVWTLRRTPGPPPAGCHGLVGDLAEPAGVPAVREALRTQGVHRVAQVIVAVAPSRARGDDYGIYPAVAAGARRLAAALGARQLLWISSTGVYGEHDGGVVTEATPLPDDRDARVDALLSAEAIILASEADGIQPVVLRPAGLYGPGRDPAPRFRTGTGSLDRWCNFSWRDDVIAAVEHLRDHPPVRPATFNCTDDTPIEAWRIVEALTGSRPDPGASGEGDGSGGRSNQRVSSAALKATGWAPAVPSIFDGLERLGHALPGRAAAESGPPMAPPAPTAMPTGAPYGPNTPRIRRFLQRMAGLGGGDAATVVAHYATACAAPPWSDAERELAAAIEGSGRGPLRDAVAGPLLQLVRTPSAPGAPTAPEDPLASLDPIAEPALAAVLALLVAELLPAVHLATLYGPFEPIIPRQTLDSPAR